MRFFHLADLHLGKSVHNVQMADADQPYWIDRFLEAVDEYEPDCVVIAGDIYDRRDPSPEAMKLWGRLLSGLAQREKYVLAVPGNHDSAARIAHVSGLLEAHNIYIAGELTRELTKVTVPGDVPVTFWLMPYVFPKLAASSRVLDREDISTYDEAVRELLAVQNVDKDRCNVLVAHQNVLAKGAAPEHSESETLIGGLGEIDVSAFGDFDYVALGHIHNGQKIGRETVRYSGCPLYYDFSETGRNKGLTLVDIRSEDDISVQIVDIDLLHKMVRVSGTLEELLDQGRSMKGKDKYYIQAILKGSYVPAGAMDSLRAVFGSGLINVKREYDMNVADFERVKEGSMALPLPRQFAAFYQDMTKDLPDAGQEQVLELLVNQQSRRGGDWLSDFRSVPEEDSQELLDMLLLQVKEGDHETP